MAKKESSKKGSQKMRLEKELSALLPDIAEEGLLFLIRQANTIIHNQRAARLNEEADELSRRKGGAGKVPQASGVKAAAVFNIQIDRAGNGKTYYFIVNGMKHFFDIPETQKLVALCYRPETKSAALKYLHEYFRNERDEILLEHKVESEKSPFFEALFREVRTNFSLEH